MVGTKKNIFQRKKALVTISSDTLLLLPQPHQMRVRVAFSLAILSNNLLFISSISSKPGHREEVPEFRLEFCSLKDTHHKMTK